MKVLVATAEGQGERADDFFEAEEGEPVMPVMTCDNHRSGCACGRAMRGVRSGRETTTAIVVESDQTRTEYRRVISEGAATAFADLDLPATIFERQADDLLKLAAQLPAGVVIERDGDDYNPRTVAVAEC
jgi:hypothetical protein